MNLKYTVKATIFPFKKIKPMSSLDKSKHYVKFLFLLYEDVHFAIISTIPATID